MEHFDDINIKRLTEILFKHITFIVAVTLIVGIFSFVYSEVVLVPEYESSVTMYVINDSDLNTQKTYTSDIQASQMLVDTYKVIIKSDTVLNEVSKKLDEKGYPGYTANSLRGGITANAVDATEIFKVSVKTTAPETAYVIANVIGEVAPGIIKDFVEASSVKIIDYALIGKQVSPNLQRNMLLGLFVGLVLSCLFVIMREIFDTRIKSDDELEQWFDYPILAAIPDISEFNSKKIPGYYRRRGKYSYYYKAKETSDNGGKTN